jgi:hypothetical protein
MPFKVTIYLEQYGQLNIDAVNIIEGERFLKIIEVKESESETDRVHLFPYEKISFLYHEQHKNSI